MVLFARQNGKLRVVWVSDDDPDRFQINMHLHMAATKGLATRYGFDASEYWDMRKRLEERFPRMAWPPR